MMKNTTEIMREFLEKANLEDDGSKGKALEIAIRAYIQPKSSRIGVTPQARWYGDIRRKNGNNWERLEVKSACGELGIVGSADDLSQLLPKADLVLYAPEVNADIPAEKQTFVFTRGEFLEMLGNYGGRGQILRVKSTSAGTGVRVSLQSFQSDTRPKASKPIAEYLWDCCYEQPTVEEYFGGEEA